MTHRQHRIDYIFTQKYHTWGEPTSMDLFLSKSDTFDILEKLDMLEVDVYRDKEFNLANEMIDAAFKKISKYW